MHKHSLLSHLFLTAILAFSATVAQAEDLVILTTNDTHSNIDASPDGSGGILNRKAIADSVRKSEKHTMLIDAGDVVQGSLYFKFFKGDVEYALMNMMDYDIQILGNHEFDNGLEELAKHYSTLKSETLSANYDFDATPAKGIFKPYTIRKIKGMKIGFFGLNVNPESLIVERNYKGLKFSDIIRTANETAAMLKNEKKCDLVVAVTHIGYVKENDRTTDVDLARASKDIDIIIGGHSHTLIDPDRPDRFQPWVENAEGRKVLVTQNGKYGKYMGEIRIDLDDLKKGKKDIGYSLIAVNNRFANKHDAKMEAFLKPWRQKVDSVNNHPIGWATEKLRSDERNGGYANFAADFVFHSGISAAKRENLPTPDFGFINVGGIRMDMAEGVITEGEILTTFPFDNFLVLQYISGSDLKEALKVAARKGGEGISANMRVVVDNDGQLRDVILDGKPIDNDTLYLACTLDYVAAGNDDMTSWRGGRRIWSDTEPMSALMLQYIKDLTSLGLPISADPNGRFVTAVDLRQ